MSLSFAEEKYCDNSPSPNTLNIPTMKSTNDNKIDIIFILGGPGAGKGTQCKKLLQEYPELVTLSTGQLLRQWIKTDSEPARQV